jgi:GR25 family glycosyltransferase involved in LPS biosynthesis
MINEFLNYIKSIQYPIYSFNNKTNYRLEGVDKVFIINLKKEVIKRKYLIRLFKIKKINFNLVIVEPEDEKNYNKFVKNQEITRSEFGCLTSHLYILYLTSKFKINFIIFEDDIWLHKNFVNLWNNFKKKNKKIEFLLLGACDFNFKKKNINQVTINNSYYPVNFELLYGAHANYYTPNACKYWLHYKINNIDFFDKNYYYIFNKFKSESMIMYPNLVLCDISSSNNNHEYQFLSKKEYFYYDNCFQCVEFLNYHVFYSILFNKINKNKISVGEDYKKIISDILYLTFYNKNKEFEIKQRIDYSIIDLEYIKYILCSDSSI